MRLLCWNTNGIVRAGDSDERAGDGDNTAAEVRRADSLFNLRHHFQAPPRPRARADQGEAPPDLAHHPALAVPVLIAGDRPNRVPAQTSHTPPPSPSHDKAATARAAAAAHPSGGLASFFASLNLDIVCLQETKLMQSKLSEDLARPREAPATKGAPLPPPWDSAWAFSQARQGYSGVATFTVPAWTPVTPPIADGLPDVDPESFAAAARVPIVVETAPGVAAAVDPTLWPVAAQPPSPPRVGPGVGAGGGAPAALPTTDRPRPAYAYEGRALETDHGAFVLFNLYAPNAGDRERDGGARAALKSAFLTAVRTRVDALLAQGREVIVVGDFNVAATPEDVSTTITWDGLWSRAEADALAFLSAPPLVDVWRATHPDVKASTAPKGARGFTVWDERTGARARDAGLRIDFCLVSGGLLGSGAVSEEDGAPAFTASCEVGNLQWSDHDGLVLDLPGLEAPGGGSGNARPIPGMASADPRWKKGTSVATLFSRARKRAVEAGEENDGAQAKKAVGDGGGAQPAVPPPARKSPAKKAGDQPGIASFFQRPAPPPPPPPPQ